MQAIQVIETIEWLLRLVPAEFPQLIKTVREPGSQFTSNIPVFLRIAQIHPQIIQHPHATFVLQAFGLGVLAHSDFPVVLASGDLGVLRQQKADSVPLATLWVRMTETVKAWKMLTIPDDIQQEKDFDDILTLEIVSPGQGHSSISDVEKILRAASKLYEAVIEAQKIKTEEPLQLIFVNSGSPIRFDFKGLGEPIKQIKELIIAIWTKIRHGKAESFSGKAKAALEGIHVLEKIGASKHLNNETKTRLTHAIEQSTLDIFRVGALPREIKSQEVVSNVQLLEFHQQKLLPAPEDKTETLDTEAAKKQPARRRRASKVIDVEPLDDLPRMIQSTPRRKLDLSPPEQRDDPEEE